MSPFAVDKRDIQFCLYEYLEAERLTKFPKYGEFNRELFDMVLDETIKFATEKLAPLNTVIDRQGVFFDKGKVTVPPQHKQAYKEFCEGGWVGVTASQEHGGQGLPMVISTALGEVHAAASVAFLMTPGLSRAAAHVIETYGTEEMRKTYLDKLISGVWSGTMCLTESGAGSAVGDLKSKARREGDHFLIEGEKIFISAGDHDMTENIVHLVLARIEGAPAGIKGVSLFLVPKFLPDANGNAGQPNNVVCGNIEHKMGIHGSPTCTMVFGGDGPCRGWLIGEENEGIKYMFLMMNEARIGVGLQGVSTASASYLEAVQYARERIQGVDIAAMKDVNAPRVPIIRHPDVRRMLLTMKAFTEGMRALLYFAAFAADVSEASDDEDERNRYKSMLELLTPVVKAYLSDRGFEMTALGIQVFGGYGYCQEYPVEQYCRDAKIASIYEGTNGIQALDLLGRKISAKGGLLFMTFLMRVNDFINEHREHPALGAHIQKLEKARDQLTQVVMHLQQAGMQGDVYYPVLWASPFLDLFGTVTLGYFLSDMAVLAHKKLAELLKGADTPEKQKQIIAANPEARFYDGKIHSMKFFIDNYMPHVGAVAESIMSGNKSPLEIEF